MLIPTSSSTNYLAEPGPFAVLSTVMREKFCAMQSKPNRKYLEILFVPQLHGVPADILMELKHTLACQEVP